ncbi:MAG: 2OG-Fe(II) oxygenase [Rhodospirillaceae bacterium]|nr:2OG-Fe(II) oxygenase [Rhodospirillaceae bacterium]|tara:strand:- start:1418 stop:2446 length:1029 start_codon:yes stop_codon:yes gene_type:complete
MASSAVPVIDIGPFFNGDAADKVAITEDLDRACSDTGFFAITGHGVDEDLLARTRKSVVDFFSLPLEEKLKVERPPEKVSRGYNRFMDRSLSYSIGKEAPPDLQEAFAFGPEEFTGEDWVKDDPSTAMLAPNRWPQNPPDFYDTIQEFDQAMRWLGDRILDIIAATLEVDRRYFNDKFDHQSSVGRVIRYPAPAGPADDGQLRAGEHTDYGTVTFLRGDAVPGGTEVMTRDGDWIEVTCPPGGFVCNIGDALARWTNDRWRSTLHRVGNPPADAKRMDRISLVYFHSPNHDALIECIPSCVGAKGPKYEPITFAEHYLGKVMKAAHARLNAQAADAAKREQA